MKKLLLLAVSFIFAAHLYAEQAPGALYFASICDKNAPAQSSFENGEFIFTHVQFSKPLSQILTLNGGPVTFHVEYFENGSLIEYEDLGMNEPEIKSATTPGYVVLPVVSDPAGNCVSYKKNLFATYFPPALAKLSAGKHTITAKVFS